MNVNVKRSSSVHEADSAREPEPSPIPERTVSDVGTLRTLSDPLRLRILELMAADPELSWTVKRLAEALDESATKLYHHVGLLEEHELIRVSGRRVVQGIIERSYRIAQLSIRLHRSLLAAHVDAAGPGTDLLGTILDKVRHDIAAAVRAGLIDLAAPERRSPDDAFVLTHSLTRLRPERARELHERLVALLREYDADDRDPAARPFGLIAALYPIAARRRGRVR